MAVYRVWRYIAVEMRSKKKRQGNRDKPKAGGVAISSVALYRAVVYRDFTVFAFYDISHYPKVHVFDICFKSCTCSSHNRISAGSAASSVRSHAF